MSSTQFSVQKIYKFISLGIVSVLFTLIGYGVSRLSGESACETYTANISMLSVENTASGSDINKIALKGEIVNIRKVPEDMYEIVLKGEGDRGAVLCRISKPEDVPHIGQLVRIKGACSAPIPAFWYFLENARIE